MFGKNPGKTGAEEKKQDMLRQITPMRIVSFEGFSELNPENFKEFIHKLFNLKSPNIVKYYGYLPDEGVKKDRFLTELIQDKSLADVLKEHPKLDLGIRLKALHDAAKGLAFLHHKNVLYKTLMGENIALDNMGNAKLDFAAQVRSEIARQQQHPGITERSIVEISYFPLEIFMANTQYSKETDIYSFGMLCWEVYTGTVPFGKEGQRERVQHVMKGETPSIPADCPIKDLIEKCWNKDPKKRPTADQVELALREMFASEQKLIEDRTNAILGKKLKVADMTHEISSLLTHRDAAALKGTKKMR